MSISLRQALRLAVGPANVDAAGHAVADWFDGRNCSGAADLIREQLQDQQGGDAVPHNRPDTSLRAELLHKLATQREVILSLCDRVDRLEMRADGLMPIERVQRRWAKESAGGDKLDRLIAQDKEADGPAVPEGREPAAARQPTDAELLELYPLSMTDLDDAFAFARAVLARWGRQPAPPVEGELAELVEFLKGEAHSRQCNGHDYLAKEFARAAELLQQRHPEPVPGASDIRYEFSVCDTNYNEHASGVAPTYAQALSAGRHYLARLQQDSPHTLKLRRVEVLNPNAVPVPTEDGETQP